MWQLCLSMVERLGIIVMVAFLLTRLPYFRRLIYHQEVDGMQRFIIMVIFGIFGIVGTYTGLTVRVETFEIMKWPWSLKENEALANSRVIGVVIAGLLGGWKVGLGAGLIAGIHRLFLGGFTAVACGISTMAAGAIAGIVHHRKKRANALSPRVALMVGMAAESLQMLVILLVAKPFASAWLLVEEIGIPMIIANGLGSAIFILVIRNVFQEEEKAGALQAEKAMRLAEATVHHLRNGLTPQSARAICELFIREVPSVAVAVTDRTHILAHVGAGSDHHLADEPIQTEMTRRVIETGEMMIVRDRVICGHRHCPLHKAIIAPLKRKDETIGTLKFYFHSEAELSSIAVEFVKGLSSLLSLQLEIAEAEKYYQLMKEAKIKALHAQVHPHFLFNALNTIVSCIRIDPNRARQLLVSLAYYFRKNLADATEMLSTLEEEIRHVQAYLTIEEARFQDKLRVRYEIEAGYEQMTLPTMTLQPLVENAVRHGLKHMKKGSEIVISVKAEGSMVKISVSDNGKGMTEEQLSQLLKAPIASQSGAGIGLYNVYERLKSLLGEEAELSLASEKGKGTTVQLLVPYTERKVGYAVAYSGYGRR
ncbi:sensor histidine kinase [Anoxybacillus rupiensis]|jgi:two-component system, LytTR family, sensor histidine kinase LytS|uniref:histidine kinase n=1 Tax=Anoxybacteroides rupiense TaxID=311460 RepID=A0ABD5IUW8_9BACL|nr:MULTISPECIES: sensor histidine kinase [Anoxybacillus]MBB3905848.1 two-component system sensor histidine kinase LytS [Anoxybacillus rupiensis]MDE8564013.1 sensor histidine kinase [Anoxybacillus rupiensis]MED5051594.1 sensor histidine kinase [Anoxybacillus rupiensis]OQM45795.1 sensor histidine kinase [Anoxybacillus sp. UARK-01]